MWKKLLQPWSISNIIYTGNFASKVNYNSTIVYSLKHSVHINSNDGIMLSIHELQMFLAYSFFNWLTIFLLKSVFTVNLISRERQKKPSLESSHPTPHLFVQIFLSGSGHSAIFWHKPCMSWVLLHELKIIIIFRFLEHIKLDSFTILWQYMGCIFKLTSSVLWKHSLKILWRKCSPALVVTSGSLTQDCIHIITILTHL